MPNSSAKPLITCIVATRNSEKYLPCCLESLINNISKFPEDAIQTVFVDYNSTDKTIEIQRQFCASYNAILISVKRPGIPLAHNIGVQAANGEYISFLNSDDILDEYFLLRLYASTKRKEPGSPLPIVSFGTVEFIDSLERRLYRRYPPRYIGLIHKYSSIILHPNALYPSALMKMIPYQVTDENSPTDREQIKELMEYALPIRVKEAVYKFRISESSHTVKASMNRPATRNAKSIDQIKKSLLSFISRIYVQSHESKLLERALQKVFQNKTYWSSPNNNKCVL